MVFSNQTDNALQLKSVIITPVNSLRNHIDKWKSIEANQYILNVIDQGYRLPFKTLPVNISLDKITGQLRTIKVSFQMKLTNY